MSDMRKVAEAIATLERIQSQLAGIATRQDDGRRHDLIDLRRALSVQIGTVGKLAEAWLASIDDPAAFRVYREKFSRMRTCAAVHQATWPAVRLDEADESYRRSASEVREANQDFIQWMRSQLAVRRTG